MSHYKRFIAGLSMGLGFFIGASGVWYILAAPSKVPAGQYANPPFSPLVSDVGISAGGLPCNWSSPAKREIFIGCDNTGRGIGYITMNVTCVDNIATKIEPGRFGYASGGAGATYCDSGGTTWPNTYYWN